ncbi:glutathione S-transferase family protein [Parahaliea sp. F7430]|uniref:Glutathione S-transferase family protein n=1 Tax=Sediminihaliea albiluteola TaxID=2758564 RepID=A0A7W2TWR8_9GAMM|nr:glutathione S-transferase family protein [Sediminihaliea albiluteola]MBA6413385.1 glutathione S-transferase family protein [Sediminihaliea albiluteola]
MKLFYYPGACSIIPHIALEELDAPYSAVMVDFNAGEQLSAEYRAINPLLQVPALACDEGTITQTPAILSYLALRYPDSGLIESSSPWQFAKMQSFHMFIATTIHILFRQISMPHEFVADESAQASLKARVPSMSNHYFQFIEDQLKAGGPWVHGDKFSASDIYLYAFASYLKIGDRGDLKRFEAISAHRQRVLARPAVKRVLLKETEAGGDIPMSLFN